MAVDQELVDAIRTAVGQAVREAMRESMTEFGRTLAGEFDARGLKRLPADGTAAARMRRYRKRKAGATPEADTKPRSKRNDRNSHRNENRNAPEGATVTSVTAVTPHRNGSHHPTTEVWASYDAAYQKRYRVPPVRNARVNGMLAKFVQRIPANEAPDVARWFVASDRGLYVSARHDVALLLRDAEGLRTEWATNRSVTESEARQKDATAGRMNVWGKLIAEIDERANAQKPGDSNES